VFAIIYPTIGVATALSFIVGIGDAMAQSGIFVSVDSYYHAISDLLAQILNSQFVTWYRFISLLLEASTLAALLLHLLEAPSQVWLLDFCAS
jgi:hypothetical protein